MFRGQAIRQLVKVCCLDAYSLSIVMTGSRSSRKDPDIESRPLYAGHRLHSIRNTLADLSRGWDTPPGFDVMSGSRRVNMGSGSLASRYLT